MSKQLRLDPAQLTDVGRKRPHNEDNMAHVIPKDPEVMGKQGALFIVADGMGGHAAGEIASEIAVDTVSKVYYQDDSDEAPTLLLRSIKRANALIHQRAAENMLRSGMGTTCVAAILRGSSAYVANVGDSRAYFIRNGQIKRISQDHSWVEEQVRAGLLTEEQARSHAQRNVITRCLGTQVDVDIDIFYEQLQEGDTLVLCSDGLSGLVSDEEMRNLVSQYPPQESVYHLVERANENGGPDNITVIVVRVLEVGVDPPGARIPVHVGAGTEIADEDTLSLGMLPSRPLAMPGMPETRIPTSPLGYKTSGPLPMGVNEGMAALPETMQTGKRKRSRLLYPTLALFVLLLVAIVAGSLYYLFIRTRAVDIDGSLRDASGIIQKASAETQNNQPENALQMLSKARADLVLVQNATRNVDQDKQFKGLQTTFVNTVQAAITAYNSKALVTQLPCKDTTQNTINNGTTGTVPGVVASIKEGNTVFSYVLGNNGTLYQLGNPTGNTVGLINPFNALNQQIQRIASDGSRLLVLTATKNGVQANYSLHVLIPDNKTPGTLKDNNASTIDPKYTSDGSVPTFVAAWGTDVYVVITSATSQNTTASILSYKVDTNNKLNAPSKTNISVSSAITSVAAFPNQQLFLLSDGSSSVFSLNLASGQKGSAPGPAPIATDPIALPLVAETPYTFTMPIPQVSAPSAAFLTASKANLLVAGADADGKPHLYVADVPNHRVLDLTATNAGVSNTATPTTKTTADTGNAGGGVANVPAIVSTTMALQQQYISTQVLNSIKSVVADPKDPHLYLITQSVQDNTMFNLVTVNIAKNSAACTAA